MKLNFFRLNLFTYCLQVIFLLIFFVGLGHTTNAQTLQETYDFAVEQYEHQNYRVAAQALQRVVFFDKNQSYPKSYQYLAQCYLLEKDYEKAQKTFDIAIYYEQNDSLKHQLVFNKARSLLLQKEFNKTIVEMYGLEDSISHFFALKRDLYLAICNFGLEDFEESKELFLSLSDNELYQNNIHSVFEENEKVSKFNPKLARYLSIGLPGLGQFYSGDVRNGINSFVINAALIYAFVVTSFNTGLLNGVLLVYPWSQRYFLGGFKAAGDNAKQIKKDRRNVVLQKLLDEVVKLETHQ